jgi:poly(hydroxyalkanoate) depolymerase family esterase
MAGGLGFAERMMPKLSDTIAALVARRRQFEAAGPTAIAVEARPGVRPKSLLVETSAFAPNPGALRMLSYRPADLPPRAPLVVVLHGCTQNAWGYAQGAGWVALAERLGFALLCPEQRQMNNLNRCFNWFQLADTGRGYGEAASIHAMIVHALAEGGLDPARVYVTGLSAGGAMTSALLACYPETFAGGAIIAGLPFGAAAGVQDAFAAMVHGVVRAGPVWGERVRAASGHAGPWPRVSIWQGDADATVNPINADEIAKQWLDVHGLAQTKPQVETVGADHRFVWSTARGEAMVEVHMIEGLAHGAPLDARGGEGLGAVGPFLLEAGVSSTGEIARFWDLTGEAAADAQTATAAEAAAQRVQPTRRGVRAAVIKALTRLGLMK